MRKIALLYSAEANHLFLHGWNPAMTKMYGPIKSLRLKTLGVTYEFVGWL
jgi:hypothetical protein